MPRKKGTPSVAETHPDLAAEAFNWDPTSLTAGSSKIRSWVCKLGHTWEASVAKRALRSQNCPYCAGQRLLTGFNDLQTTHPQIASEANGWDPTQIGKGFKGKKDWLCPVGHNYQSSVDGRTNMNAGCSICAGKQILVGFNDLESKYPEIASEASGWDPKTFTSGSNKKMEWKCPANHIYFASIDMRTRINGTACPYCVNQKIIPGENDLETRFPNIALQASGWDPKLVGAGHKKKLNWLCENGHEYFASPSSRTENRTGCPVCAGLKVLPGYNDLQTTHPDLAVEADGWDPKSVIAGSAKKYLWKCSNGHSFTASVNKRAERNQGCAKCQKYGFNPGKEAYLYFLQHLDWEMLQIGITNDIDERFAKHKRLGWQLIEFRGPIDGQLAQQWETAILRMLNAKGADLSNSKIAGKFDGYSEAWSKSTFEVSSIKELMKLTEEFEEKQ